MTAAVHRVYGGLVTAVMHSTYLPFTADQLQGHFAPVLSAGEKDRHLRYYLASIDRAREYDDLISCKIKPTPAQTRLGRQMKKDERFWVAAALMALYHADAGRTRAKAFGGLLERAGLHPPGHVPGGGV